LENRPIPVPKDDEVLIRMSAVGICGSDVSYLVKGAIGDFVVKAPMVLGHEAAGIVTKLGKDVKSLQVAKSMGADFAVKVELTDDAAVVAKKVEAALGGMPDITIECSGAESSIKLAILGTKSGGCVVLVGLGPAEVKVPIVNAATREVDIRGVFRYANCYPTALAMIASGTIDVKKLITHHFKLEETIEAFETSRTGAGGAIKVMIHC